MPASEHAAEHAAEHSAEREARSRRTQPSGPVRPAAAPAPSAPAVSMRDLLASCAAASAVSTPPRTIADGDRRDAQRDAA
ncbi:hypothetical protein AB0903_06390 [Streptomyces sp. NPDC048389]|uniref:hypothetical protein n=1 Tax=Streptomyces sp. NPDC048389 TaxID=3154622 RepID=UPI0034561332